MKILPKIFTTLLLIMLMGCSGEGFKLPKPGDARTMETEGQARARKNVEEGKGFSLKGSIGGRSRATNYEFSTSNPLWRATFDVIDFMPLVTVDYSGGMIITDWYTDSNTSNDSLKFTIRFLSNEIRADGLKIKVFSKECKKTINCKISESNSKIESELKVAILKRAAKYKKDRVDANPKRDLNTIIAPQDKN